MFFQEGQKISRVFRPLTTSLFNWRIDKYCWCLSIRGDHVSVVLQSTLAWFCVYSDRIQSQIFVKKQPRIRSHFSSRTQAWRSSTPKCLLIFVLCLV